MMESLAKTRERRNNAGNRMGQMLEKEEEDFYKSTYGGFYEVNYKKLLCMIRFKVLFIY